MKLLLIAPKIDDVRKVRNFSGVWSHFLAREFSAMGIEMRFAPPLHGSRLSDAEKAAHYRDLDLDGIDHILAIGTRYFTRVPNICSVVLRGRFAGAVTQIHDAPIIGGKVDCTFTLREGKQRGRDTVCHVGWAADPEICAPRQDPKMLTILVDHADYVERPGERSNAILKSAQAFIASGAWRDRFDAVRLRRIVDGGVIDHDGDKVGLYGRGAVPFVKMARIYGESHLFLPTHPESVGMTVLETAMAGALPVSFEGHIHQDRLATVRHLTYRGDVPWGQAVEMIDPEASRSAALPNSWRSVAGKIVDWLTRWQR